MTALPMAIPARAEIRRTLEVVLGCGILAVWLFIAASAGWIAPHDPDAIDLIAILQPPNGDHWLGTDHLGRDVLARIMYGARVDVAMSVFGVLPAMVVGVVIGLVSGYFGGWIDAILMRLVDITVAFPFFVLLIAIVGMLGPGLLNFFLALALVGWVSYARLIRSEVLVLRDAEFVQAARGLGYHPLYILIRHVFPNAAAPIAVYAMSDAVMVMLAGASLGFIGMGVQPPTAEWGAMIADGQPFIAMAWWICLFPGLAAASLGLGFLLLSDGLAARWIAR
ncbi:MAG TPA: ABC transporter permease [Dongiaceae bacterium]|nr:ABC transporter permease [Dongiaceae bacterium]